MIGAFTEPSGSGKHFGALLLGAYDHSKPGYAGKVGTGFEIPAVVRIVRKSKKK